MMGIGTLDGIDVGLNGVLSVTRQAAIEGEIDAFAQGQSWLGAKVGSLQGGGEVLFQDYANGTVYDTFAVGGDLLYEVHGAIYDRYRALGGPTGVLGAPTTSETATADGVGRYNRFQHGAIYWSPSTGAYEVHGAIYDLWSSLGWEHFGYPITDESGTPDGRGRYNHFSGGGSVYWTPTTGAHEVHGAIHTKWASMGWEQSPLGYPVTSEFRTLDADAAGHHFRISTFEHGFMAFKESDGSVVVVQESYPYSGAVLIVAAIFWGRQWDPQSPWRAGQDYQTVHSKLKDINEAGVFSALKPYGIGGVLIPDPAWVDEDIPGYFFEAGASGDPTKGFTDDDLTSCITRAIDNGWAVHPVHDHEDYSSSGLQPLTRFLTCYVVFMPDQTHFRFDPLGEVGHHRAFNPRSTANPPRFDAADDVRFAWVAEGGGGLSDTISIAIHEIVESAGDAAGLEIGDRCDGDHSDGWNAEVAGITPRSYWSNFHGRCVLPPARDPITGQQALE